MPPLGSELADSADDLLARRLRAGIWLIIAGNVLFTVADAEFRPAHLGILFVIQAVELLAMLGTVAFLRTRRRRVVTTWLGVVLIGFMCITTALSGVLTGETGTTLLSLSLITMGTATLLPWGFRPQLAVQSIAALAAAWNMYAIAGSAYGVRYLLIGVVIGFAATLYAAHAHEQHRREQARAEAVLEETRARRHQAELAHASRLSTLGEMAAGLAHELNQPLSAIVGWATGCLVRIEAGTADVDTLARVVSEISDEALRAGEVLRRIREFARSGEMRRERIDPNELVMSASRLARGDANELGVSVWFELGREVPAVEVDRVQIEQVILNLFRNAFDAMSRTRRGERRLLVTTATADPEVVEVAIGDSGDGIPPAMESRIFDPFFTTKEDGLGLGLAISRRIVEAHGGRLWATPNAGRGTTFHFTLPLPAREAWDAA